MLINPEADGPRTVVFPKPPQAIKESQPEVLQPDQKVNPKVYETDTSKSG